MHPLAAMTFLTIRDSVDGVREGVDELKPMMCLALWAVKHEVKHCIEGKILDDCPLTEIVTCKDCEYNYKGTCEIDGLFVIDDYFCENGKRRE